MVPCDAIVIGVGAVGSAALDSLAARGVRAVGIDRFPPGHDRGSSHGETRLIRLAYFEHPDYVPLLRRAYELWADLERDAGRELYRQCGLLQTSLPGGAVVAGVLRSAAQHGLNVERLTPGEVRRRFPGFTPPDEAECVFEERAGYLHVEACVRSLAARAQRRGARLEIGQAVHAVEPAGEVLRVTTDRGLFEAPYVVLAAGAWSAGGFARGLVAASTSPSSQPAPGAPFPELRVLRKSLYWFPTSWAAYHVGAGMPGFICETEKGAFYGFPSLDGGSMKVAEHTGGIPVDDPLQVNRSEDPVETARVVDFIREYLPHLQQPAAKFGTCLYTMSPDQHFLVDRHPWSPRIGLAAGLSGHGFKFATVLGEILADWCTTGTTAHPVEFLGLKRFAAADS